MKLLLFSLVVVFQFSCGDPGMTPMGATIIDKNVYDKRIHLSLSFAYPDTSLLRVEETDEKIFLPPYSQIATQLHGTTWERQFKKNDLGIIIFFSIDQDTIERYPQSWKQRGTYRNRYILNLDSMQARKWIITYS